MSFTDHYYYRRVSRGANGSGRSQWQAVDGHSPLEAQQDCRREPFDPSTEFLESPQSISTCPAGAIAPETGKAVVSLSGRSCGRQGLECSSGPNLRTAIARAIAQQEGRGQRAQNSRVKLKRMRACNPTETSVGRRVDALIWRCNRKQERDEQHDYNSCRQTSDG